MVPRIETERLLLRGHRMEDLDASAAMWTSPDVVRYISGKPFTREEVWARLLRYTGHWQWMGFGFWALEEKSTGLFAGELGFAEFKRELDPSLFRGSPEVGWVLAGHAHGKGYATEAVRAAIAWGDRHFSNARTVCMIDSANLQSLRVAEKCGFRELHRTTYKGAPSILLERPQPKPQSDPQPKPQSEPRP